MNQGRQSRLGLALASLLAALAALLLAIPASASASPAAVEEYDFVPPEPNDPQDPVPEPEPPPVAPEPDEPVAPVAPVAPTEQDPSVEPVTGGGTAAPAAPEQVLDRAAARRDVLFERAPEASAREARTLAVPVEQSSLPPALWLLFGFGGVCVAAILWRLRRFAGEVSRSGSGAARSQTSS